MIGSMAPPSDSEQDRKAPAQNDASLDDGWTAASPAHNDQTLHIDAASVGQLTAVSRKQAAPTDHDQTKPALDIEALVASTRPERATVASEPRPSATTPPVAADAPAPRNGASEAKPGAGDVAREGSAGLVLLEPGKGIVPLQQERVLVQTEKSPLDYVMAAAPSRPRATGDSSIFVASLMPSEPPAVAEVESTAALEPVPRRARARRKWMAACAVAGIVVAATAVVVLGRSGDASTTASPAPASVIETPAPPPAAAPSIETPALGTEETVEVESVAKPATTKKTVASKTAKKPTATTKPTVKKTTTKKTSTTRPSR
jgi:ribonuclease E